MISYGFYLLHLYIRVLVAIDLGDPQPEFISSVTQRPKSKIVPICSKKREKTLFYSLKYQIDFS